MCSAWLGRREVVFLGNHSSRCLWKGDPLRSVVPEETAMTTVLGGLRGRDGVLDGVRYGRWYSCRTATVGILKVDSDREEAVVG